jgi:hypothetical protein
MNKTKCVLYLDDVQREGFYAKKGKMWTMLKRPFITARTKYLCGDIPAPVGCIDEPGVHGVIQSLLN